MAANADGFALVAWCGLRKQDNPEDCRYRVVWLK